MISFKKVDEIMKMNKIISSAMALLLITGCAHTPTADEPTNNDPADKSVLDDTTQNGSMSCKAVIDEVMAMDGLTHIGENRWARGKDNIYTIDMLNQTVTWKNWESIYNGDAQMTYRYHASNGRMSTVNSDGSDSYINQRDEDYFLIYELEGINQKLDKAGCSLSGKDEVQYLNYEHTEAKDTSVINYSVFDWIFETKREDGEYRWVQNYLNKEAKLEDSEFYHHLKNKEEADAFQPDDNVWCGTVETLGNGTCTEDSPTSTNYVITISHKALSDEYNTFIESQKRVQSKNLEPDNAEPQPRAIVEFVKDFVYLYSTPREYVDDEGFKGYIGPAIEVGFLYVDEPGNESILQPFSTRNSRNPYQVRYENGEAFNQEENDAWEEAWYWTSFNTDYKDPKVYYPSNLFARSLSENYNETSKFIYQINSNLEIYRNSDLKVACDAILHEFQPVAKWFLKDFTYAEDFTQNIANFYDFGWRMEHGLYELWGDQYGY